jgi:uncharacterized protein YjiS (DUF1127 family)
MTTIVSRRPREVGQSRTWDDLHQAIERGRDLRAQAVNLGLRRAAAAAWRIGCVLLKPLRRASRRQADTRLLLGLSDHMLADIGLERADVRGMAYGVIPIPRRDDAAQAPASAAVVPLAARRPGRPIEALAAAA